MKVKRVEQILAVIALMLIILAGILGVRREAMDAFDLLDDLVPDGYRAESLGGDRFALFEGERSGPSAFLIKVSSAAYGGDMEALVLLDSAGIIRDMKIARHRETPSFLELTEKNGLRRNLIGKSYEDPFILGEDVDVVSGATYSARAIVRCAQLGSTLVARDQLKQEVLETEGPDLEIGIPEIALLVLFALALLGIYKSTKHKKTIRWVTMLGGLVVLGFWFAVPLTLSKLNTFLLGYFPDWHTQLYWYLLLGGFVLSIVLTRKNVYCHWICPLGGLQECLGAMGGAKPRFSKRFNGIMKWVQRGVALLAILLALYFRNPVKLNYEIFGVALSLTGASYLFVMTGIFIMASAFVRRPWCTYLCPVVPVEDMLRFLHSSSKSNSPNS
jgi:hypothetical protein